MSARLPLVGKGLVACLAVALSAGPAEAHGVTATNPTALTLLTAWSWDPLPLLGVLIAGAAYVVAARRVNRTDPRVRITGVQVAFWFAGLAAIFIALTSAIDIYAEELLSVHMVQHLLLAMVAPPLLALAAPVTLAAAGRQPGGPPRRLILPVLHSRALRVLASPVVAWLLFTAAMWLMHFSPIYNAALEDPLIHDRRAPGLPVGRDPVLVARRGRRPGPRPDGVWGAARLSSGSRCRSTRQWGWRSTSRRPSSIRSTPRSCALGPRCDHRPADRRAS